MRMKILAMFAAAVLVAACSSEPEETVDLSGQNQSGSGVTSEALGGGAPGSNQDFAVNVGDRVYFGFDRFDLSAEARAVLDRQAQWLSQYPNTRVVIEGHADERGTREYNLALGERRATAVRNYLVASGIAASRVSTISYGKERPEVVGSNESAWAQNRRAVTVVN
jgi:peptidoglycan-associated lipoprotein